MSARSTVVQALFALVIAVSVLAMGALDTGVLCLVTVVLAAAAGLAWLGGDALVPRGSASVLLLVCLGLTLYTLLQAVPLPAQWINALSPHAGDVWAHALDPFHQPAPSKITLSVDPASTRVEVLRGVAYGLTFLVGLRVAHRRGGTVFLERTLLVAGVSLGLVALVHELLDAKRVFGVYEPRTWVTVIAPLLNANQLAGYLNIALCIAFASMIAREPIAPRPILGGLVVTLFAAEIRLASRGAVASVIFAMLLCVVLTIVARRERTSRGLAVVLPTLVASAGATLLVLGASETTRGLTDSDMSKLSSQWHELRTMAAAYPIFGAGRGSFEAAYQEFRPGTGHILYSSPENVVVQWVSEWGGLLALPALVAIGWALRPKMLLARSQPPIGPWAALLALALHNLVDFSSEVPGVVIALVVCAAIVVAGSADGSSSGWIGRWGRSPKLVGALALAAGCGGIALALPMREHNLVEERLVLRSASVDPSVPDPVFLARLGSAVRAHPAEPYFPFLGAAHSLRFNPDANLVPWIDRTLERSPVYPPAHLLLARWFRPRSRSQALLEYRLAAEQDASSVALEAEALVRTFEDVQELTPSGAAGNDVLESLANHVGMRLPATAARIDGELTRRDPNAGPPCSRELQRALADLEADESSPWCASNRAACIARALEAGQRAEERLGDRCEPYWLHARVRVIDGRVAEATDALALAADRVSDRALCLRRLAEMAIQLKQETRANEAIEKLAGASCATEAECVDNVVAAAALEEQRGNRGKALALYQRAAEVAPDREDLLLNVGRCAAATGLHSVAAEAWSKLAARHPGEASYAKAASDETAAARGLR